MFSFIKKLLARPQAEPVTFHFIHTDMHSHILPGLDDGAETLEKSMELLRNLQELGYRKLIMTPHIMGDFYRNTPEGIREKLQLLQEAARENGIDLELDCAAEYYMDEWFTRKLEDGEPLLTFGQNYLLFETSYINRPSNLNEVIFMMKAAGYQPVLAHPERYTYLYGKFDELKAIRESGVLLQLNLNSLAGYYSPAARHVAEKLVRFKMVDMVGTDLHSLKHIHVLRKVMVTQGLRDLQQLPLLNNKL